MIAEVREEPSSQLTKVCVAFQGEIGANSQAAVYAFFGKENVKEVVPLPTLRKVFSEISKNDDTARTIDYAVVPIENTTAGTVGETCDLLIESNVKIVGETSVPVRHMLMVLKDASLEKISRVISHPQALAQCREYLERNHPQWEQVSVYDTAGAAKMIKQQNLEDTAAIASELASEIYGLRIVERNIEDEHSNRTRFVVVENPERAHHLTGSHGGKNEYYRTTVVFSTKHEPGALVRALSSLATRGLNLDKIESRPILGRPWEYYFYVDFEGHEDEERCRAAIADLKYQTLNLKVLGSYKRMSE